MGADGTRDDVKLKICSDGNAVCCTSDKLSNLLSREWVENKQETWASGKFGKCKKSVFKVMLLKVKPTGKTDKNYIANENTSQKCFFISNL